MESKRCVFFVAQMFLLRKGEKALDFLDSAESFGMFRWLNPNGLYVERRLTQPMANL